MNSVDIIDEVSQNFLDGSLEVNMNRAFPDVRDGLKPGQRACIWEMYLKKYNSNKPHVKSAKVSGGVIADLWPHGDQAIYDTFVRMSQSYINNLPEVDFHGANGNIILGDDAVAAARYTECRLAPITEQGMLKGVEKNVVDMIPNYSDDIFWPKVLPAIFPRLLVNGSQGIGVSLSNYWCCHNFKETAQLILDYISTGKLDMDNYFPDFPTGGTIINKDDLAAINITGKGKIILQGKYTVNKNEINFYEMPYQSYIEPIIEQISEGIDTEKIHGIKGVYNKSDKKTVSLVIECIKATDVDNVLIELFKETDLRKQINVNQNALISKTPILFNLQQVVDEYINHNLSCIKKEYEYDYDKAVARIHIIEGLLKAIDMIDEVIKIIRTEKSPKTVLMTMFSEKQTEAILDMRLAKLSKLEKEKLEEELDEKIKLAAKCQEVINSEDKQKEVIKDRLQKLSDTFGEPRRTEVCQVSVTKPSNRKIKEVLTEDVVIIVNEDGYIKSIPLSNFKIVKRGSIGSNFGDKIIDTIKTNTKDMIILFSSSGRMFRLSVGEVDKCNITDKGTALGRLIKLLPDEKIIKLFAANQNNGYDYILFATQNGFVKKVDKSEFVGDTQNLNGVKATTIKEDDKLVSINFINNEHIILITNQGYSIRFDSSLMNPVGKTAVGVKGITLGTNDYVVSAIVLDNIEQILIIQKPNSGKRLATGSFVLQGRGGKGAKCGNNILTATPIFEEASIFILANGKTITISAKEVPILTKTALGNKLIKTGEIEQICVL